MRWLIAPGEGAAPCGALELFPLDLPDDRRADLEALLDAGERARAGRFMFPQLRERFIVAHGRLRQVLGEVLGHPPAGLRFEKAEHGKPYLADNAALHFNLSHSDGWGLVGWAQGRELGVDVERWRPMRDELALVRRFFSPAENAAYDALDAALRTEGFFQCWTRKEAYIKAVGRGLGLPLDSFDVSLGRDVEPRLLRASTHCEDGRRWSLAAPQGPNDVSIAIVLESDSVVIQPVIP
jgi:4'-phosphopantetheinyl transferase